MTPLKAASRWRELEFLATTERAKYRTSRYGMTLEVTLVTGGIARGPQGARVVATVGHSVVRLGYPTTIELDRREWGGVDASDIGMVEDAIADAKQWAVIQANRLVGAQ
jgi:hypothetical protein